MERLTRKRESPLVMSMWGGDSESLRIYNRLAEYENTGLNPKEVKQLKEYNNAFKIGFNAYKNYSEELHEKLDRYKNECADKERYINELYSRARDAEAELKAYKQAERERNERCEFCNGEYNIFTKSIGQHTSSATTIRDIVTNFCPNCGSKKVIGNIHNNSEILKGK